MYTLIVPVNVACAISNVAFFVVPDVKFLLSFTGANTRLPASLPALMFSPYPVIWNWDLTSTSPNLTSISANFGWIESPVYSAFLYVTVTLSALTGTTLNLAVASILLL